jgi:hypothetical protein
VTCSITCTYFLDEQANAVKRLVHQGAGCPLSLPIPIHRPHKKKASAMVFADAIGALKGNTVIFLPTPEMA